MLYTYLGFKQSSEFEGLLKKIYDGQMDAILFSINQYSNDVLNGFTNKLDAELMTQGKDLVPLMQNYAGINGLYVLNAARDTSAVFKVASSSVTNHLLEKSANLDENLKLRLLRYKKANFKKLEIIPMNELDGHVFMAFVAEPVNGRYYYCVAAIESYKFLNMFLIPKLQQIAGEGFVISFKNTKTDEVIYTTGQKENDESFIKDIWFFEDYILDISLKGDSLDTIIKTRSHFNMVLLGGVTLLLAFGFWLVFFNVRRELRLTQAKTDFISNVSHEIRTPLALISMFAETLELGRAPSEAKKQEYYRIIGKETTRLRNIINKILNFSQIESNKKQYHLEPHDLNQIAKEVIDMYSFHLENNGFTYDFNLSSGNMPILADKDAIIESLINLIENAMKYSPDKKDISIASGLDGEFCFVEIADKGIGISAEKQTKIFDKFYRITEGDIYKVQGAGLGLSIVKHIMQSHHGRVEVKSKVGQGSAFRLYFKIEKL